MTDETMTLTIGDTTRTSRSFSGASQLYRGWQSMRLTRSIERMSSGFDIGVSERWAGQDKAWQVRMFDPCTIAIDGERVLTGYVDTVSPAIAAEQHEVRLAGRSKTEDLIDCEPDLASGQFRGYTLAPIARAVAAPFGIEVVVEATPDVTFPDAMMERCETAYEFLERLGRLSGILLTDDELGRLVLTRTGTQRMHDALIMPGNVLRATATLSGARRYSRYVIKGQHAQEQTQSPTEPGDDVVEDDGDGTVVETPQGGAQTLQEAVALDPAVPRFRQHVSTAEGQLDAAGMQARVRWQAISAAAKSTQATVVVRGWRQSNGDLWRINRLVSVTIPQLELDQELLIVAVTYTIDQGGHITEMLLGPPEGYTPDPGEVKLRKHHGARGRRSAGIDYSGAGGIQ